MTCHCGRDTWKYDHETLTCKAGHRTLVAEPPTPVAPRPKWYRKRAVVLSLTLAVMVVNDLIVAFFA